MAGTPIWDVQVFGIPVWILAIIGIGIAVVYLIISRESKVKEFKALDLKKETKKRFKKDYKYFGMPLGKNIYDVNSETDSKATPLAYAIGYMKIVEMKEMKRLEPIYSNFSKEQLELKHEKTAQEIYEKAYKDLTEIEKKNIDEVSKDELRNEKVEVMGKDENIKISKGKREIKYSEPIPMFTLKVCSTGVISKILAKFLGIGVDWWMFDKDQIIFEPAQVLLTANFQRRQLNDIFIFSKGGKNLTQDIGFGIEREQFMGAVANSIDRVLFHNDMAMGINIKREDAKIEREKHKSQTESREFG